MTRRLLKLALFASHNGSNVRAVVEACETGEVQAEPVLIVSNNRRSKVLDFAREKHLDCICINENSEQGPEGVDSKIYSILQDYHVDLVLLLGYMKKLGPKTLSKYGGKVLNIHPSLLPKFGGQGMYGMNVHKAVLDAGDPVTGATIHIVNENYDEGQIIAQRQMSVLDDDNPESLAKRVLKLEHVLLVGTLKRILAGAIVLPMLERFVDKS